MVANVRKNEEEANILGDIFIYQFYSCHISSLFLFHLNPHHSLSPQAPYPNSESISLSLVTWTWIRKESIFSDNDSTLAFRINLFISGVYMINTSVVYQYKQENILFVNHISWFEDANTSYNY